MGNLQSSPSSSREKYDVFLSFRGEDTRDCFTSHLYEALHLKLIGTFIDNQLIRGDEISPALTRVIKESKISILIFSKDYASSKWCLRELVEILKCKETNNQIVLPVFYRVDPSDVRNQTGSFKDSFVKHEKELQEKLQEEEQDEVQTWRKALTKASNLSGWHSSKGRTDATLVNEIVDDIWEKLMSGYILPDFAGRIGLERIKRVISLLCLYVTTDVRIIGIWGMGGIGKTTLANDIFNKYSDAFDGFCFIQNVRERLADSGGLVSVQKEILSKVLKHEDIKLDSLTIPPEIKKRLNCLKVFIVLDDVTDNFSQMKTLVGDVGGLGQGSRIIITSRNKQVLRKCCVNDDNIYEVKGFNHHEAFQLFCNHAFDENCHIEDPMVPMVNRLVSFTNGNPLALIVLGSLLYNKSKQDWESVVNKFELTNLCPEIFDILKISYNRLSNREKNIFLDIACFLKGRARDYVEIILNDRHYSLGVLIDKSLITISSCQTIEMHDMLEEMGRDIVNKESPNEIDTRSRMWKQKDVLCTLKNDSGTLEVQGIFLDMFEINKDIHLSPQAFKKMLNLRLLKFYYSTHSTHSKVIFSEGLSDLSDELRSLIWYGYPLQALPSNFNPINLGELDLRGSNLERLCMEAPNLRWLNLSRCTRVTEIQGLTKSPLLESINLKDCSSLLDFPQLAQHLKNLRYLDLLGCNSLRSFPSDIHFESLAYLDLSKCNNLTKFGSQISGNNITRLDLSGTAIKELHHSISHLNGLKESFLRRCENLETLPSGICNLTSLQQLDLSDCSRLEILPDNLGNLKSLKYLSAKRAAIKELPHSIANLNGLKELFLGGCENLETLPSGICNLTSLQHLDLSDCSRLEILPENLGNLKSLKYLYVKRAAIKELPHSIANLNGLKELFLGGCENLETLPSGICNLTSLLHLDLSDCSRLEILPENLGKLKSLEYLSADRIAIIQLPPFMKRLKIIRSWRECSGLRIIHSSGLRRSLTRLFLSDCNLNYIPKDIGCLSSLVELDLSVNNFEGLPQSMMDLRKLEFLHLDNCNGIVSLIDLPSNLTHLSACDCKQLQSIPNELDFARILKPEQETATDYLTRARARARAKPKPKPTEFIFTNCIYLEETADGNMLARLVKYRHQGYINFSFCYPGSEVPKWFRYRNEGSSIKFQKTFDPKLKGFAVCAVIAFEKYLFNGDSEHKLGVHFDGTCSDGDQSSPTNIMSPTAYFASRNRTLIDSDHVAFACCDANYRLKSCGQFGTWFHIMSATAYFASRNRTLIDSDHVAFAYCDANYRLKSCGNSGTRFQNYGDFGTWFKNYGDFGTRFKNYSSEFRLSKESPNYRLYSCGVCPIYVEDSNTDDSDEAGTSGGRFDEEELEPHPKENKNLQTVKYAEQIEHIGETSGIRRSRTSNDHLEEEVEPHPKRLNI